MAPIRVPSNLPELVKSAFGKACASGHVIFYPTQVTLLQVNSLPFQLRFSPSLANKPKGPPAANPSVPAASTIPPTASDKSKPAFDPFDHPPPQLLIADLAPGHILVLNKFAIVPEHFILATRDFRPQTHLLEAQDLEAAYQCICAYNQEGERGGLFAFFNSGEGSGASQPHRHLQLLPVGRMRDGLSNRPAARAGLGGVAIPGRDGEGWEVLARQLKDEGVRGLLPFQVYAENIEEGMDGARLREVYIKLYRQACEALGVQHVEGKEARVSYNLAMTDELMVVMPRVVEGAEVKDTEGVAGKLALNGTVLAGTALVKTQREWDALREDPGQVAEVLKKIGVPNTALGARM